MSLQTALVAAAIGWALAAAPAWAQHHGHEASGQALGLPVETLSAPPMANAAVGDPMSNMDHSQMDHGAMAHEANASPGPTLETQAPAEAGNGPPRAADAIWGADAMRESRADLQKTHGDFPVFWFQADRFEQQARSGETGYLWDVQGYFGGPTSRFWFKSEGEGLPDERTEHAEFQALYAHAVSPFWDLQLGVRQDLAAAKTSHAIVGIQGVAPYLIHVDAAVFVSQSGDITARMEAEHDQRITQRLILQPRAEIDLAAQDVPRLGIGAGIGTIDVGVRLRYEIIRELAPYIGLAQTWQVGNSADLARARGASTRVTHFVAGVRFWF